MYTLLMLLSIFQKHLDLFESTVTEKHKYGLNGRQIFCEVVFAPYL